MNRSNYMPIREFSRLCGIRKENLRFYDQIGLLTPEIRQANGYRFYSRHQLNTAYLISSLRELGLGLEEIKQYSLERTPEKMLMLFAQQDKAIKKEIDRLKELREIMKTQSMLVKEALTHGELDIVLMEKEQEPIYLCPPVPCDITEEDGAILAYDYAEEQHINIGYPFCAIISQETFRQGMTSPVHQYYFKAPRQHNGYKPNGLYVLAYARCDLWNSQDIYRQLFAFIEQQKLIVCGDVYEESPINEMSEIDTNRYCIQIEVPVKPKHLKKAKST